MTSLLLRRAPLVALVAFSGCAPSLYVTRWAAPEASLGSVRQLGITVNVSAKHQVTNALVTGLFMGQITVPSDPAPLLQRHLAQRLPEVGVTVCPAAPCGDATLAVDVHESSVGGGPTEHGDLRVDARLGVRIRVTAHDGRELMAWRYDEHAWDRVDAADQVLERAADGIAVQLVRTLLPRQVRERIPLEDAGPLGQGVKLLLGGDTDGAERYFLELAQRQPDLAGVFYDLGVIAEVRGDYARAASFHRQAIQRDAKRMYFDAAESAERKVPQQPPPLSPDSGRGPG